MGSLTVERTIISNNSSGGSGGGISAADFGIPVLIQDCLIRNNTSMATRPRVLAAVDIYLFRQLRPFRIHPWSEIVPDTEACIFARHLQ